MGLNAAELPDFSGRVRLRRQKSRSKLDVARERGRYPEWRAVRWTGRVSPVVPVTITRQACTCNSVPEGNVLHGESVWPLGRLARSLPPPVVAIV